MKQLATSFVTILTMAGLFAAAQRAEQTLPPAVANAIGAIQPRISPDGQTIAVSYQGAIWTIPRAGGMMTRLTSDAGFDIEPVWSPDGEYVAYVNSPRFGAGELRIVSRNGTQVELPKRIEVAGTVVYHKLEWLSGDRILSAFKIDQGTSSLSWINWKTGETRTLAPATRFSRYAIAPNSSSLVYTTTLDQTGQQMGNDGPGTDVWQVPLASGEPKKLFRFPSRIHDLCYTSDGDALIVVAEFGGGHAHNDLWHVPFRDPLQRMRKITFGQADEDRPSVSRDGKWLAFTDNQHGPTSLVCRNLTDQTDQIVRAERLEYGVPTVRLEVSVVDEKTQQPITARVSITQVDGKFTAPPASLYRVLDDFANFYCVKNAEWKVPAGRYRIRAYHGLEFRPLVREIELQPSMRHGIKLELQRWAELPQKGWYSGENHIHANYGYGQWYSSPRTTLEQCAGEGIGVNNFVVANSDTDGIYDREHFKGRVDELSSHDTILYWNQEFRSTIWGHMTLVNLKQVVEPIMTGFKETTNPWDIPTNADIADRTHMQGGHVNYTHVAQNPDDPYQNAYTGKGIPIDVALGKVDTLDLNASYAGTTVVWYKLLNCGFRVGASAGTDCFLNRISSRLPGADRVYVKLDDRLDYTRWVEGLKAGRSFVTNGPMLQFSVGRHQPGDSIKLDSVREITISAQADSHFPMSNVDVIYNGQVAASVPLTDSKQRATLETTIRLDRSGWLALRAMGPGQIDHPTPSLNAHTSPIYVELTGSTVGSRQDAEFFLKWIDRLSLAIRLRDRLPNEAMRRHVEDQFEAARAVYLKIAESNP